MIWGFIIYPSLSPSLEKRKSKNYATSKASCRRSHPCRGLSESEVSKGRRTGGIRVNAKSLELQLSSRLSEAFGAQLHHLRTELDPLRRIGGLIYPSTTLGPGGPHARVCLCTVQLKRVYRD